MFRLWEIVSVIQDLACEKQLEILDSLELDSEFVKLPVFRSLFTLRHLELIVEIEQEIHPHEKYLKNVTRLSLVYVTAAVRIGMDEDEIAEITDYFVTLDDTILLNLWYVLRAQPEAETVNDLLVSAIANYVLINGLNPSVPLLQIPAISCAIFRSAITNNNSDLFDQLLESTQDPRTVRLYAVYTLRLRKIEYFRFVLDRYFELAVDVRNDKQEATKQLMYQISISDLGDSDYRMLVRMILMIAPQSHLEPFALILERSSKEFIAAFTFETICRFDWSELYIVEGTAQTIIKTIIDGQV